MIELCDASFSYRGGAGAGPAPEGVRNVSLSVEAGRCVLVCGPSGCGKTTVTRLANGLAPAFFPGDLSGRVLVDGRDASGFESWEMAARVGSVFQNPRTQFFNVDSTGEVAFALESLAWPEERVRARVRETIAELGLEALADRSIFELSGGEKQRVAYAGAWAARPANLVLDEPTSNLDEASIEALAGYVLEAKRRGTAVLVAEHRLWWLSEAVDEVVVMGEGRIVRRFGKDAFWALPAEELAALGLRTRDLSDVRAAPRRPGARRRAAAGGRPVLALSGVKAAYGRREALGGADVRLFAGEVVALVGANGAGKSTLCRAAVGLHRESAGAAALDGAPAGPKERLRAASMVFQDVNYQLFADSVEAEVSFGLGKRERPSAKRVGEVLEGLGLAGLEERHPATLSGGQKQRLAVAACVASGKRLLVFDEPTSGLDLGGMRAVADLVRRLADEGRAVLVVTHDLEFVARACDRALLVEKGRVAREAIVEGDLADVRALLAEAR